MTPDIMVFGFSILGLKKRGFFFVCREMRAAGVNRPRVQIDNHSTNRRTATASE
jgi:hypothetical protein